MFLVQTLMGKKQTTKAALATVTPNVMHLYDHNESFE
jgi:hypothetical protein